MALDLSDIPNDADVGTEITILRTTGYFGLGGWLTNPTVSIPAWGAWAIADDKALRQVPEGDRVTGAVQFITATLMFTTSLGASQTSDQVQWGPYMYRVQSIGPWILDGFFSAILVRMTGT